MGHENMNERNATNLNKTHFTEIDFYYFLPTLQFLIKKIILYIIVYYNKIINKYLQST